VAVFHPSWSANFQKPAEVPGFYHNQAFCPISKNLRATRLVFIAVGFANF
jgi:hypothetical protein